MREKEGNAPIINILQPFLDGNIISPIEAEIIYLSFKQRLQPAQIAKILQMRRVSVRNIKRHGLKKLPQEAIGQLRGLS